MDTLCQFLLTHRISNTYDLILEFLIYGPNDLEFSRNLVGFKIFHGNKWSKLDLFFWQFLPSVEKFCPLTFAADV